MDLKGTVYAVQFGPPDAAIRISQLRISIAMGVPIFAAARSEAPNVVYFATRGDK